MKNLFQKLSEENSYCSAELMQKFYYSFLRVLLNDLRDNGKIVFPDFGTFEVRLNKEKRTRNVNTKMISVVPAYKGIKFRPSNKLKYYIKNKI